MQTQTPLDVSARVVLSVDLCRMSQLVVRSRAHFCGFVWNVSARVLISDPVADTDTDTATDADTGRDTNADTGRDTLRASIFEQQQLNRAGLVANQWSVRLPIIC